MKNLTIKKVALAVFLAGFTASSAYAAALSATSSNTIKGNAPLITDSKSTPVVRDKQRVDVKLLQADGSTPVADGTALKVGDYISIRYNIQDADGDSESTTGKETAVTVSFFYSKDNGSSWTEVTNSELTTEKGAATWKIPVDAMNANKIGFKIQGNTQFGDPRVGDWLTANDIASTKDIGNTGPTDPGAEPGDGGTGGGEGGGNSGPSPTNPVGPSDSFDVRILFVSGNAAATAGDEYQEGATGASGRTPLLGDVFEAKVFDKPGDGATDLTSNFNSFTWYLKGGNAAANGNFAAGAADKYTYSLLTVPTGKANQIQLPSGTSSNTGTFAGLTGAGAAAAGSQHAGAQGFKLGVDVESK